MSDTDTLSVSTLINTWKDIPVNNVRPLTQQQANQNAYDNVLQYVPKPQPAGVSRSFGNNVGDVANKVIDTTLKVMSPFESYAEEPLAKAGALQNPIYQEMVAPTQKQSMPTPDEQTGLISNQLAHVNIPVRQIDPKKTVTLLHGIMNLADQGLTLVPLEKVLPIAGKAFGALSKMVGKDVTAEMISKSPELMNEISKGIQQSPELASAIESDLKNVKPPETTESVRNPEIFDTGFKTELDPKLTEKAKNINQTVNPKGRYTPEQLEAIGKIKPEAVEELSPLSPVPFLAEAGVYKENLWRETSKKFIDKAIEEKAPVSIAKFDVHNLTGLNDWHGGSKAEANVHFKDVMDIVTKNVEANGGHVFASGSGDEFKAVLLGDQATAKKIIDKIENQSYQYAKDNGLENIPNPKSGSKGFGVEGNAKELTIKEKSEWNHETERDVDIHNDLQLHEKKLKLLKKSLDFPNVNDTLKTGGKEDVNASKNEKTGVQNGRGDGQSYIKTSTEQGKGISNNTGGSKANVGQDVSGMGKGTAEGTAEEHVINNIANPQLAGKIYNEPIDKLKQFFGIPTKTEKAVLEIGKKYPDLVLEQVKKDIIDTQTLDLQLNEINQLHQALQGYEADPAGNMGNLIDTMKKIYIIGNQNGLRLHFNKSFGDMSELGKLLQDNVNKINDLMEGKFSNGGLNDIADMIKRTTEQMKDNLPKDLAKELNIRENTLRGMARKNVSEVEQKKMLDELNKKVNDVKMKVADREAKEIQTSFDKLSNAQKSKKNLQQATAEFVNKLKGQSQQEAKELLDKINDNPQAKEINKQAMRELKDLSSFMAKAVREQISPKASMFNRVSDFIHENLKQKEMRIAKKNIKEAGLKGLKTSDMANKLKMAGSQKALETWEEVMKYAETSKLDWKNKDAIAEFVRDMIPAAASDKLRTFFYGNLFSPLHPATHITILGHNLFNSPFNSLVKLNWNGTRDFMGTNLHNVLAKIGVLGKDVPLRARKEFFRANLPFFKELFNLKNIKDSGTKALGELKSLFNTSENIFDTGTRISGNQLPIYKKGTLANKYEALNRAGPKLISINDRFFRGIAGKAWEEAKVKTAELAKASRQQLIDSMPEGYKKQEAIKESEEIYKDTVNPQNIKAYGIEMGKQTIFNEDTSLSRAIENLKGLNPVVDNAIMFSIPVFKFSASALKFGLKMGVVGVAGQVALGMLGLHCASGTFTADRPSDRSMQNAYDKSGRQPWSMKIGNSYVPLSRFPMGVKSLLMIAAAFTVANDDKTIDESSWDVGKKAVKMAFTELVKTSPFEGLRTLTDALEGNEGLMGKLGAMATKEMTPQGPAINDVKKLLDHTRRKTIKSDNDLQNMVNRIMSGTPLNLTTESIPEPSPLQQTLRVPGAKPQPVGAGQFNIHQKYNFPSPDENGKPLQNNATVLGTITGVQPTPIDKDWDKQYEIYSKYKTYEKNRRIIRDAQDEANSLSGNDRINALAKVAKMKEEMTAKGTPYQKFQE